MAFYDLHSLIMAAKLGRARKDAQVDTCAVFAAALYDVAIGAGMDCQLYTAAFHVGGFREPKWYHSVVAFHGNYYDSQGTFDLDICRRRLKVHPTVRCHLAFQPDTRDGLYEEEFEELYQFYAKALRKSAVSILPVATVAGVD